MATDYTLPPVAEKRTRFFDGQFLVDQDFVDEQKYHLDRQRRHQRLLHVSGVCDGLEVRATGLNTVSVGPGTAVDPDGRTLALASAVTVELPPKTFNSKSGVTVYLTYEEAETDEQEGQGSAQNTRWLERPVVVRLLPGEPWTAPTPPVTLAQLALDGRGAVTVDLANRQYAGVRLPGPAADPAALRSVSSGAAALQGTLSVTGHLGVGTASPENAEGWQRVVDVLGGVSAKLSVRTGAVDTRVMAHDTGYFGSGAGMIVGTKSSHALNLAAAGATRLTITPEGHVGIGTTTVNNAELWARIIDMYNKWNIVVNLRTDVVESRLMSHDDGYWGAPPGMIIGTKTAHPLGLATAGTARVTVGADGKVGVGLTTPAARLDVAGVGNKADPPALLLRAGNGYNNFDGTQVAFGNNGTAQYRHAIRSRHNGGAATGNALDFYVWAYSTAAGAPDVLGGTHVMSLDGGHVGVGTTTAENAENWTRVVDVLGTTNAKLSVRTGTGKVDGRVLAHDSGVYGSAAGMVVGTKSNHAVGLATNGITHLTVTPEGHLGVGSTAPDNAEKWARVIDLYARDHIRTTLRTDNVEGRVTVVQDRAPSVPGVADVPGVPRMERGMFVGTKTAHALGFMTSGVPRMILTSDGHLGIGPDPRAGSEWRVDNPERVDRLVQVSGKGSARLVLRTERLEGYLMASETALGPASAGDASFTVILTVWDSTFPLTDLTS